MLWKSIILITALSWCTAAPAQSGLSPCRKAHFDRQVKTQYLFKSHLMFPRIKWKEAEKLREREIPLSFFTIIIVLSCLFHYLLFFTLFNPLSAANLFQLRQYKLNCGWERKKKSERGRLNDRRKRIEPLPSSFASLSDYWPRMLMRNEGVSHRSRLLKHTNMR